MNKIVSFHADQYDYEFFDGLWMPALEGMAADNVSSDEFNEFIEKYAW